MDLNTPPFFCSNLTDDFEYNSRDDLSKSSHDSSLSNGSREFIAIPIGPLVPGTPNDHEIKATETKEHKGKKGNRNGRNVSVVENTRVLEYPPCCVCGGKASGDHYGVNSCEPCKGFFRRYLLRKKGAYQCKNTGHCEIIHTKKGMCSGCRLQKCLHLGMSKDNSRLGRYRTERRTEMIQAMKATDDDLKFTDKDFSVKNGSSAGIDHEIDLYTRTLSGLDINDDKMEYFTEDLIPVLIKAKNAMNPFGKHIDASNKDDIKKAIRSYNEAFQLKLKLYGEMKTVPKEDFEKMYNLYGIDVDDRLSDLRGYMGEAHSEVYEVCNFAKCIPYFSKLPLQDQANLLKANHVDACITVSCQGYDPELQIAMDRYRCYHISEMDKIFTSEVVSEMLKSCLACQRLNLDESEQVLVMACCLLFNDRCPLENPRLVEKIQLSLTQLLKQQIENKCKGQSHTRLAKIFGFLTDLRNAADMYTNELGVVCKDDIYGKEFPMLSDFLVKDETSPPGFSA